MEAKELVGKRIRVDDSDRIILSKSGSATFKVVGYNADMNLVIIGAGRWGWDGLDSGDLVTKKCKHYWYIRPTEITKVL